MDKILKTSRAHPDLFFIVLQNTEYDLSKTAEYERFFSAAFLSTWRHFEKEQVQEVCGGKYRKGKQCGFDSNPVTDGVPLSAPYVYRTVLGDNLDAVVSAALSEGEMHRRVYYLRRENGGWKLGGLYSEEGTPATVPEEMLTRKFRQPKFESEKRLEEILHFARTDEDSIPFVLGLSWRDPSRDRAYSRMFTPALLLVWRKEAQDIVENECNPEYYKTGKANCRLLDNPVSCRLEELDYFAVRKTQEGSKKSVIAYSKPDVGIQPLYTFRMVKDGKDWRLDGVDCGEYGTFNLFK